MGFFRNLAKRIGDFVRGEPRKLPRAEPQIRPNAGPRTLPGTVQREVSRETPAEYVDKLHELTTQQDRIRRIEQTMFDDTLPVDIRKAALEEYVNETGWYRPENNDAWSNEEWARWAEIYESEPEVF